MFVYRDEKGRITDVRGSVNHAELERLQKEYGEVEAAKAKGDVVAEPDLGPDPDTVAAFEAAKAPDPVPEPPADDSSVAAEDVDEEVDVPSRSDAKAEWVAFAVSQGLDQDEAEGMIKQDLIDQFGG
jgi:hypothetical protein